VFLASERGRALRGEVLTMTRDSLAVLRPVSARTAHTDTSWTVESMAAAVKDLTAASGA
jgi:hypothetical protein